MTLEIAREIIILVLTFMQAYCQKHKEPISNIISRLTSQLESNLERIDYYRAYSFMMVNLYDMKPTKELSDLIWELMKKRDRKLQHEAEESKYIYRRELIKKMNGEKLLGDSLGNNICNNWRPNTFSKSQTW